MHHAIHAEICRLILRDFKIVQNFKIIEIIEFKVYIF